MVEHNRYVREMDVGDVYVEAEEEGTGKSGGTP
jgi:hypothetical protein